MSRLSRVLCWGVRAVMAVFPYYFFVVYLGGNHDAAFFGLLVTILYHIEENKQATPKGSQ